MTNHLETQTSYLIRYEILLPRLRHEREIASMLRFLYWCGGITFIL